MTDLKIDSDKFFNYVPVNGFDKFIMPERKELFISKLKEYGFELFYKQEEVIEKRVYNELDISNYVPYQLFSHFIKYCNRKDYTINEIDEALVEYKNAKGTRKKTWEKLYKYCVEKKLAKNCSSIKYNFHNKELDGLLSYYNKSYLKFMDTYFSEDNLLSKRPYVYGQTVIWDIFENYNVSNEHYLFNLNHKLAELKNHVNYIYIKDIPISDIINFYELSNIFLNERRLVNELGIELYDKAIIKIFLDFMETLPDLTKIKNEILKSLSEREFKVLRNRHKGKTLAEIAKEINVTRERVRQIESKAKRNLKDSSELNKMINFVLFKFRNKSIIQIAQIIKYLNIDLEYC
ncbi:sigma factor-like helix-turn-helix DNA-binding protein, partial [Staphylococcus warneri]|uniref:sigma factor-like helix-turn-helix DNA-binding protein n=2 Tax=Staphylococcus warneri TaxID=1292 RepID=UPI000D4F9B48